MATLKNTTINDTGFIDIPSGTIAQRPASPAAGMYRFNTDLNCAEFYNGTNWINPATGQIPMVTNGLTLYLDAGNPLSYPSSTSSVWYDLSGNGYNFFINGNNFGVSSGIPYMDFSSATYGIAKRVVNGVLTDIPSFANATVIVFSSILNSTATWRTLFRGTTDHQVIVQTGANTLGMYDNPSGAFYSAGFDITTLPNYSTQFNCLIWKLSTSSPYYSFQYNTDTTTYTITNANATFSNGWCSIGGYHGETITPITGSSQYWGKVGLVLYYNRHLSAAEITQTYNAFKGRFGL